MGFGHSVLLHLGEGLAFWLVQLHQKQLSSTEKAEYSFFFNFVAYGW